MNRIISHFMWHDTAATLLALVMFVLTACLIGVCLRKRDYLCLIGAVFMCVLFIPVSLVCYRTGLGRQLVLKDIRAGAVYSVLEVSVGSVSTGDDPSESGYVALGRDGKERCTLHYDPAKALRIPRKGDRIGANELALLFP